MGTSLIEVSLCKGAISMLMLASAGCFDFDALTRGSDLDARADAGGSADLLPRRAETCTDLPDGSQTLFVAADPAKPWAARCVGGRAYLPLARVGAGANYSQYTAGGYSIGQNVVTRYTAVRLDPVSLFVDVSDQTFSTSSGVLQGSGERVSSMPYGVAMDCVSKQTATGKANIDLRDTPFAIRDNVFAAGGVVVWLATPFITMPPLRQLPVMRISENVPYDPTAPTTPVPPLAATLALINRLTM
jgi:hypothetical protein